MLEEKYALEKRGESVMVFDFVSEGPKGAVRKVIEYSKVNTEADIYNLGFADELEDKSLSDQVATDNKDSQKVLATVAYSAVLFTDRFPDAWIYAKGSTPSRTRLYRIGLSNNLEQFSKLFLILGVTKEGNPVAFEKCGDYDGFLVRRRKK